MFDECIEVFEAELNKRTEKWLSDTYVPTAGTYALINIDDNFSCIDIFDIKPDKKTGKVEGITNKNYELVTFLDKNSKIITMNKAMDIGKIIHSNNYYSFFVKKESILLGKVTPENIKGYYEVLQQPEKKYKKAKGKEIYKTIENELGEIDKEVIDRIKEWVITRFNDFICNSNINIDTKDYLKIFFVYEDEEKTRKEVEKEGKRYILPNIYNNNDYNIKVNDEIFGVHGNNMGLNDKKPYLNNKSRKVTYPNMVTIDRALMQYKFMEYLSSQAAKGRNNIYIDYDKKTIQCVKDNETVTGIQSGIYLRVKQGKTEVEIYSVETVTGYEPKLKRPFTFKEIFALSEKSKEAIGEMYGKKYDLGKIESIVNEVFFGKFLINNYKTKASDLPVMGNEHKALLLTYRDCMWTWFHHCDDMAVKQMLTKLGRKCVSNSIEYPEKAKNQLNLWFSLEDYFEKNERRQKQMDNVREEFINHLKCKERWMFENDEEYYYAVGQVAKYFSERSQKSKKTLDMLRPIISVKKDEKVKEQLKELAKKYAYAVETKYYLVGEVMANIFIYKPQDKVNDVMIMAGYVDKNNLYMSTKVLENQKDETKEN